MNLFLYLKSVLTYESHTYRTLQGVVTPSLVSSIGVIPYFWLCLLYWQDLQDLFCDRMVFCIPFQSITDLISLSLLDVSGQGQVIVIPIDCPICRDAGTIGFHPFSLLCFKNADPILMFLHLFRIDLVIFLCAVTEDLLTHALLC